VSNLYFDITVDYLVPATEEVVESFERSLPLRKSGYEYLFMRLNWSGYPESGYSFDWKIDDMVPTHTLSISIERDGYQGDSIRLVPTNLTSYEWRPLLHPLPGAYRPRGLSFYRAIPSWMWPSIVDITSAILFSEPGPDENQDGVVDVSDILHVLNQGP